MSSLANTHVMNRNLKDTKKLHEAFKVKHGVKTDSAMFKKLGLDEDSIRMVLDWIKLQSAFSFNEGYELGENAVKNRYHELKSEMKELMRDNRYFDSGPL